MAPQSSGHCEVCERNGVWECVWGCMLVLMFTNPSVQTRCQMDTDFRARHLQIDRVADGHRAISSSEELSGPK